VDGQGGGGGGSAEGSRELKNELKALRAENAEAMRALIRALKNVGIDNADLRALGAVIRGGVKGALEHDKGMQEANGRGAGKHVKSESRLGR
jgi:hypothetical protein